MMLSTPSLIDQLETTMRQGSAAQRAVILQRVTDLFLQQAESYSEDQVALFDDVMMRLVERIEQHALVQLSTQLAPIENAPANVVQRLARDDDIKISGPVIEQSPALSDNVLLEIAYSKGQEHLAAIAGRASVSESVTDALVERGNHSVTLKVTQNSGARFSRNALFAVANRAHDDELLAESMVSREDIPPDVFEHLLSRATEVVRQRLLRQAGSEMRTRINQMLASISTKVANGGVQVAGSDGASAAVSPLQNSSQWLKLRLSELARSGRRSDTIATLAALSNLPIQSIQGLLRAETEDGVLIVCKGVGLNWSDTKDVLSVMTGSSGTDAVADEAVSGKYARLSVETANRVLRFVKACKSVSSAEIKQML